MSGGRTTTLAPGELVAGRFDVLALAGAGGMGTVYRAHDRDTDAVVALKLLAASGAAGSSGELDERRFAREAAVLSSLDHPAVVRCLDHGVTEAGQRFLVMEWLTGQDLESWLQRGRLSAADATTLATVVADALASLHTAGVVHRDLKPSNLLLVEDRVDSVKLIDFGLARTVIDDGLSSAGVAVGTPAYMAPEQIRGEPVDARVDVYALGAVLFRCLVGRAPFTGEHPLAVLAKVLIEQPPRVSDLRGDVSAALDDLIAQALAKDPAGRAADGAALRRALRQLADDDDDAPGPARARPAITAAEQRVVTVVLCGRRGRQDVTVPLPQLADEHGEIAAAAQASGGVLQALPGGPLLVTFEGGGPAERAARASRCALAIAALRPTTPIAVATGRVLLAGTSQVGEVIDLAVAAVVARAHTATAGVVLDETTAALLDDRFTVDAALDGADGWARLRGERDAVAPLRTLLGRATPCVGRDHELATLRGALDACVARRRARPVLIVAPPGLGKSRLLHELLATAAPAARGVDILTAQADSVRAGSPFALARRLLRRAAGFLGADPPPVRAAKLAALIARTDDGDARARRITELLGEIAGVPTAHGDASLELRAARADAQVMADALREGWADWLDARCARAPQLIILEDLQWGDLPSLRLLDGALDRADDALLIVATARPEVHARFPALWSRHGLIELHLAPLDSADAGRLVEDALGDRATAADRDALVARAAGHPFYLEELVRAVAAGHGPHTLPDSVLSMVQSRLDVLDGVARRTLRAASVFGETFWAGGVAALLGDAVDGPALHASLAQLWQQELIVRRPSSRLAGEREHAFRHGLVREAAYAALPEHDRGPAHRAAGAWLEAAGEDDAATLAEHFDRGGVPGRAAGWFQRAAGRALEGNDLERAAHFVERARRCGPGLGARGALDATDAEIALWSGRFATAVDHATTAAAQLAPGSAPWFDAIAVAITAHGQRGASDAVGALLGQVADAPADADARGAAATALCRGLTQLYWSHHAGELARPAARLAELAAVDGLEPYPTGWILRVRGEAAFLHDADVDACLELLDRACAAFERAGARRQLCLTRLNRASLAAWGGEVELSARALDRVEADAALVGAGFLGPYARAIRALRDAFAGAGTAEPGFREALVGVAGSPRLVFICRTYLGWLALDRGDAATAAAEAAAAAATPVGPELRAVGHALIAATARAHGALDDALAAANAGAALAAAARDHELTDGLPALVLAQVLDARGDRAGARAVIADAHARLAAIAARIADPARRARFWARRLPNDRIAALATAWGVAP